MKMKKVTQELQMRDKSTCPIVVLWDKSFH